MRPTRVIYVENDRSLRGNITQLLEQRAEIEVLLATGIAHEALDQRIAEQADVALLDLDPGRPANRDSPCPGLDPDMTRNPWNNPRL